MIRKLTPVKDKLCKDCQSRLERNPLRIFDCKNESCQALLREVEAPTILDRLCDDCQAHFQAVTAALDVIGLPYQINPYLVRGLDYYTRTAWEFTVPGFSTIAGGGRYNGLVQEVGGPETPGVGFAGGVERALMVLQEQGATVTTGSALDAFVVVADEPASRSVLALLHRLRQAGLRADRDYQGKSVKSQFKTADREQARFVLILGSKELESGVISVKDLGSGEQVEVPEEDVVTYMQGKVNSPS